jgi:hypothetical protein
MAMSKSQICALCRHSGSGVLPGGGGVTWFRLEVNGFHGAHGLARSVMKLVAHMSEPADGLVLRVLVNTGQP